MIHRRAVTTHVHGTAARIGWFLLYLEALLVPLALTWLSLGPQELNLGEAVAMSLGLVAFSALVVAVILPARVSPLIAAFGIETILRIHRSIAKAAVVLVWLHLVAVLMEDPRGFAIFDLAHTTWAARAATCSTVALFLMVGLAITRSRRQPRYEGWRLVHNALAWIVLLTAWLHVWWLRHLISKPLLAAWFFGTGLLVAALTVRRWLWLPLRARRRSYLLEEVRREPGDGVTLTIRADRHHGVPFNAGQFAWLKFGSTAFVFEEHPFSITSTAVRPHLKQFTIKALGDFTELLSALRPGRRVFLDGPYGGFTIEGHNGASGFIMIAAGVGITPMLSMLRTLADRRDCRRHWLIVAARTVEELMLRPEIEEVRNRLNLKVVEVISKPGPDWIGETGRISGDLLARYLPRNPGRLNYFLCGPAPMVHAVSHDLAARGIPLRRIHTERFGAV
ncbi:ferredoxin reductase family protein [Streptomyces sp. SID13031]|uniref:ferredoxin reductase family protein n=1 Tax=Streptomyces sp. SID13031 TaxID=2706046 RepID=UPI0013CD888D|nr:ferredoxin reductase family protein [Streptomyces sp. SID13031]NEA30289.1 ferredoxin reductase family protein [Streptomyces sp. SID13031]